METCRFSGSGLVLLVVVLLAAPGTNDQPSYAGCQEIRNLILPSKHQNDEIDSTLSVYAPVVHDRRFVTGTSQSPFQ